MFSKAKDKVCDGTQFNDFYQMPKPDADGVYSEEGKWLEINKPFYSNLSDEANIDTCVRQILIKDD
jgi:hypothetical protein